MFCIYCGNCLHCTIFALMSSYLSKSIQPRNWHSSNGLFTLSLSLSLSMCLCSCSKSDYLRKKRVWARVVRSPSLAKKDSLSSVHLLTVLFGSWTSAHACIQWVSDTMRQPQLKHNCCASCANVDSRETMSHHCSRRCPAAFKDMALKDSKTAQCVNTDMSRLYSQHAYSY